MDANWNRLPTRPHIPALHSYQSGSRRGIA